MEWGGGVTALQGVVPEDLRMRDRAPGDRRALGEQQRSDPHKPILLSQSHPSSSTGAQEERFHRHITDRIVSVPDSLRPHRL